MIRGLLYILITFFLNQAFAQQSVTISGSVSDSDSGEGLPGANVYLLANPGLGTSTDSEGNFDLSVPFSSTGDTLVVTFIGFVKVQIPLSDVEDYRIDIVLRPEAISINEIKITGEKLIAEEFTLTTIKKLEIYMNPSAKADPILAVNSLPFATTTDESANISFRGSSPAETGIFLDEVPIYDAVRFSQLNGIGTFSVFNTSIIDEVQVFPGNPPLEFGNTSSGLIALSTNDESPGANNYSTTLSLASFGLNMERSIGENTSLRVFSNYQPSAAIRKLNMESLEDIRRFQSNDAGIHFLHDFSDRIKWKVFNYTMKEEYDFQFEHPTFQGLFLQRKIRNFTTSNLAMRLKRSTLTFNQGLSLSETNFLFSNADMNFRNRDIYLALNYQYYFRYLSIKSGLSYDRRSFRMNSVVPEFDFAFGEQHPFTSFTAKLNSRLPEAYTYAKYFLGEHVIIGGGIRQGIPVDGGTAHTSSQGNIHYKFDKHHSVNLSTGKYHKSEFVGNSDQLSISNRQHSIDYKYEKGRDLITASVFHKTSSDSVLENTITGFEIYSRWRPVTSLTTDFSYTYINSTSDEGEGPFPGEYDLRYFLKGSVSWKFNYSWTITSVFRARDGVFDRRIDNAFFRQDLQVYEPVLVAKADASRLKNYATVDISINRFWALSEKTTVVAFLSVSNILNRKNIRELSYNFDYSQSTPELFSRRTIYFGIVLTLREDR